MTGLRATIAVVFAVILVELSSLPVHAAPCRLELAASLAMTESNDGLTIPVTIAGQKRQMIVDTGAPLSSVEPSAVKDLGLTTNRIVQGRMFTVTGQQFTAMARIPDLQIGAMKTSNARFLVFPADISSDKKIAGLLGADFLRHYEIDLDFGAKKLNVLNQNHCPGKVIYWRASAVAVVPMRVTGSGHIIVPVTLDGKALDALFDTGSFGTLITMSAAKNYLGVGPESPGVQPVKDIGYGPQMYTRRFKTLTLAGIAINNPTIYIQKEPMKYAMQQAGATGTRLPATSEDSGATPMTLGMNELRHLHIFVSYKEEKLYITAATPPPQAAHP